MYPNYILNTLNHSDDKLSIVIDNDGTGFDNESLMNKSKASRTRLFFMNERISYINGYLFIH